MMDSIYTDENGVRWRPVSMSWGQTPDGLFRVSFTCEMVPGPAPVEDEEEAKV